MYEYKIVQMGIDGSRITLEEIAATPALTEREMEEFIEDRQVYWMRQTDKKIMDISLIKIERTIISRRQQEMSKKIGFMSLPKNAHNTVRRAFGISRADMFDDGGALAKDWLDGPGKHQWLEDAGRLQKYDFLFSSIRHPLARFVSSFYECQRAYKYTNDINQFTDDLLNENLTLGQLWHSVPQTSNLIVDELNFVIRIENIAADAERMSKMLGTSSRFTGCLYPLNKGTYNRSVLVNSISADNKKKIEEYFYDDFVKLNYRPEW